MPGLNGIEACRQIREILPDTQVVMLSMHSDEGYVLRALKAGARAYLLKDSAEADLARAIRAASEGKSFFSPAVGKVLLEDYMRNSQRTGAEDSYELLSPREREILQLVAEGKSSKEIADLLNLSVYTVETHRARVMQKLNLRGIPGADSVRRPQRDYFINCCLLFTERRGDVEDACNRVRRLPSYRPLLCRERTRFPRRGPRLASPTHSSPPRILTSHYKRTALSRIYCIGSTIRRMPPVIVDDKP